MRKTKVQVIVSEPWYNAETTRVVADKAHALIVTLPGDVGAQGIHDYADVHRPHRPVAAEGLRGHTGWSLRWLTEAAPPRSPRASLPATSNVTASAPRPEAPR